MPRTAMDILLITWGFVAVFVAAYVLSAVKPALLAAIALGAVAAVITMSILRYVQRSYRK
jgi:hypothetical protein